MAPCLQQQLEPRHHGLLKSSGSGDSSRSLVFGPTGGSPICLTDPQSKEGEAFGDRWGAVAVTPKVPVAAWRNEVVC